MKSARGSCSQRTLPWPHSPNPGETFEGWATESRQLSALVRGNSARPSSVIAGGSSLPTLTATCNDRTNRSPSPGAATRPGLELLLPTLKATDSTHSGPNQRGSKGDLWLHAAALRLPTLIAGDSKDVPYRRDRGKEQLGGLLHPDFCDWYQGLPVGWTRAERASPLQATRKYQRWLRLHSRC